MKDEDFLFPSVRLVALRLPGGNVTEAVSVWRVRNLTEQQIECSGFEFLKRKCVKIKSLFAYQIDIYYNNERGNGKG